MFDTSPRPSIPFGNAALARLLLAGERGLIAAPPAPSSRSLAGADNLTQLPPRRNLPPHRTSPRGPMIVTVPSSATTDGARATTRRNLDPRDRVWRPPPPWRRESVARRGWPVPIDDAADDCRSSFIELSSAPSLPYVSSRRGLRRQNVPVAVSSVAGVFARSDDLRLRSYSESGTTTPELLNRINRLQECSRPDRAAVN